jgi:hypothetical protein
MGYFYLLTSYWIQGESGEEIKREKFNTYKEAKDKLRQYENNHVCTYFQLENLKEGGINE